ncbi:UDP-N-acetylmuramoyl-tripeptide--D-alanyl-D-alanine ligase [Thermosipho ferrireducens]|uniref:UDP-N-acetylmuramoyl-tripeptide--D-alanyl-D-alanine ligase n=1 Tax=Thermosipho ferrireducens TaxID=2571116 RepID=A0ABX7S910_9BACT|nr:UDP-N-acetylmuramoyl-tripeptide--D-alanyl-D-alanine ligase [Thermosipho ferrireducens]QTA38345.1 UDP-N-acetylmuramoyl-tripeptide--D-alanyl-D-alanine ligase [Thermosipho ferrireducens]
MFRFIFLFLIGFSFVLRSLYSLHMLQLEEYSGKKFIKWAIANVNRYLSNVFLVIGMILFFFDSLIFIAISAVIIAIYIDFRKFFFRKQKKPLVYTKRLKRLLVVSYVLFGVLFSRVVVLNSLLLELPFLGVVIFNSFYFWIINALMLPLETAINNYYLKDGMRKFKSLRPVTVAVTGSYGKTSTKYFINHLLGEHYSTLMTPESYNTSMGITRTIREKLDKNHEIFVVEFAENEKGGYKRLLKLVKPDISVITSIGIQHFEEFGSMENILKNFAEYAQLKDSGKVLIVNADDENIMKVVKDMKSKKVISVGIENVEAQYRAENIDIYKNGSKFTLKTTTGLSMEVETPVYGLENIRNILLAIATAFELKVPVDEVLERLKTLTLPDHRLQIIRDDTVTVIDDTFNSNPKGSRMALDYLKLYNDRRKIIVTPGYVELGEKEDEEHVKLGKEIAKVADYVFLVGEGRTKKIYEGLILEGFSRDKIKVVRNLEEVSNILKTFVKPGDVILFENDLPDTYES